VTDKFPAGRLLSSLPVDGSRGEKNHRNDNHDKGQHRRQVGDSPTRSTRRQAKPIDMKRQADCREKPYTGDYHPNDLMLTHLFAPCSSALRQGRPHPASALPSSHGSPASSLRTISAWSAEVQYGRGSLTISLSQQVGATDFVE